ncbi:aldo/keto reductase [Chthonobacter albigriseus]|uniref:aldo/keto reductase n=1 Tax=Chthonobacter albigriseus TaxID=1683161 RepID=UPI0015EF0F51|nr:aldo/keto reductase [Chthonobacter albigriseus]
MQQRRLGRTDIHVGVIGLGTMTFGQQNTEAEGHAQMDRAVAAGVNLLDAAELYPIPPKAETQGRTEEIIGTWLKARGRRDDVVIATKVIGRSEMRWFRDGGVEGRLVRGQIEEAVDKSLKRLQTDVIDLYQVHWPDRATPGFGSNPTRWTSPKRMADETPIEETLAALADVVKAGKVRYIGLSNESAWGAMRWLVAAEAGIGPRVVSIQNAYSLVNRTWEGALAEVGEREDVSLIAYSPLAQGYLSGKYENGGLPEGSRKQLFDRLQRYEKPHAAAAVSAYVQLARDFGVKPAVFANAFVANQSVVTSSLIGATTMDQLEDALAAASLKWTREMQAAVDDLHQRFGNPCP